MVFEQEILIRSNDTDAAAKPTALKKKEVAGNLLDRSLFGSDGTSVFRFYEHPEKYFNEFGFANNALKLGGFLPTYFQQALVSGLNIKTINGQSILGTGDIEISGGGSASNIFVWQLPEVSDETDMISDTITLDEFQQALAADILIVKIPDGTVAYCATMKITDDTSFVLFKCYLIEGTSQVYIDSITIAFYYNDANPMFLATVESAEINTQFKTINGQSIIGEGNINIQGGSGGSGGSTPLLTNWDDYDAETMAGYALGAGLGVEDHEQRGDIDEVLEIINGTMGDEPHIIPNDTIIYKHLEVREGIDTTDVKADTLEVKRIDLGNSSISIDTTTGKAVFDNLDLPVGATQLNELKDVNLTEPLVDGQALVYDANKKKYVNKVVAGVGGGLLLKDWANYAEGAMDDYGVSAKLAYDIYNDVNGLDGILDEINGSIAPALDNINGETI